MISVRVVYRPGEDQGGKEEWKIWVFSFLWKRVREIARGDVEDNMALTDEVQAVGGSIRQELYDRRKDLFVIWRWEGVEGRFRVTKEEEQVEREWFWVTSEWRYAGRLELSAFVCERKNSILISFIYIKPTKRFKLIGVIWWNLWVLVTARAAELRTSWRQFVKSSRNIE